MSLLVPVLIVRTIAWQLLLKEQKIKIGFFKSIKIYLIGFFYCSFTPAYVGHLVKIPYMKEETNEPYGKLFVNVLIDSSIRTFDQFIMILVGAIMLFGIIPELFWINFVIFGIICSFLFYIYKKERGEKLFHFGIRFLIPKKLKNSFYSFVNTFYYDFPRPSRLIIPVLLGFVTWTLVFSQEYIMVMALDINIPYHMFILLVPVANVAGILPITFAGLGVREATSIAIFSTLFAVSEEKILVASLMGFIITVIFVGFIGFLVSLTEAGSKVKIPKVSS
jgi:hypothetical protein